MCDSSSAEVSRWCTIVLAELVKPPVSRVAWTSPPIRIWEATECQVDVALKAWWGSLGSLSTCSKSELQWQMIGSSTGPTEN